MPKIKDRKKIENTLAKEYSAGFVTDVESETFPPGINEDVIIRLSKIKKEPKWLLDFRLNSYRIWESMKQPDYLLLSKANCLFDRSQSF